MINLKVIFETNLNTLYNSLDTVSKKVGNAGNNLQSLGSEFMALSAVGTVALGAIIKKGGEFETVFKDINANLQPTTAEMEKLKEAAKEMGKGSIGPTAVSEAILMLGKNGLSTQQILDGALKATKDLSLSLKADMAGSADLVTDVMGIFNIQAKDLTRVVDQLAGVTVSSKFGFNDLRLALAQGGAGAAAAGLSFDDLALGIASTASVFASGSDAGTSFKTFLTALTPNSNDAANAIKKLGLNFFDANGQILPLRNIAEELQTKLTGLSDAQRSFALETIFGSDAARTAYALYQQGAEGLDKYREQIDKVTAAQLAAAQSGGFDNALKTLSSSFELLAIKISESGILDFVTKFITLGTGLLDSITALPKPVLAFGTAITAAAVALPILLVGVGGLMSLIPTMTVAWNLASGSIIVANTALRTYWASLNLSTIGTTIMTAATSLMTTTMTAASAAISAAWAALTAPISLVVISVAALGAAFIYFYDDIKKYTLQFFDVMQRTWNGIVNIFNVFTDTNENTVSVFTKHWGIAQGAWNDFVNFISKGITWAGEKFTWLKGKIFEFANKAIEYLGKFRDAIFKNFKDLEKFSQTVSNSFAAVKEVFRVNGEKAAKAFNEGYNKNLAKEPAKETAKKVTENVQKTDVPTKPLPTKPLPTKPLPTKPLPTKTIDFTEPSKQALKDAAKLQKEYDIAMMKVDPLKTLTEQGIGAKPLDLSKMQIKFPKIEFPKDRLQKILSIFDDYKIKLATITEQNKLFGNSTDLAKQKQALLRNTINDLVANGLPANSAQIQALKQQYADLGLQTISIREGLASLGEGFMTNQANALGLSLNMDKLRQTNEAFANGTTTLSASLKDIGVSSLEAAGASLAAGESFKEASHKIVKSLIAEGIAAVVAKTLAQYATFLGPAAVPIAAGAGLLAAGLFQKIIPAFAKGGVIKGETIGLMGEYPGASTNPEIVTPQKIMNETFTKSLNNFFKGNGEFGNSNVDLANIASNEPIVLETKISGEDLYIVQNRYSKRAYRQK